MQYGLFTINCKFPYFYGGLQTKKKPGLSIEQKSLQFFSLFQRFILFCILTNTFSMGIEYHSQPEWLTKTVEISNLAFSIIFAVEMILKLLALGFFQYIADGFNVFDGVIVILRYVIFIHFFKKFKLQCIFLALW